LKFVELLKTWKGKHPKVIAIGITLLAGVSFWFGLKAALRTDFPLLPVNSSSMQPTLNHGDLIVVQGVTSVNNLTVASSSQKGDIIVFHKPSEPNVLVISRVIDKAFWNNAWYLRTKADKREFPDRWMSGLNAEDTWGDGFFHEKFLVGKVVGRLPFVGYVPLYVGMLILNPAVMFLLIVIIFIVISLKYPFLFRKKTKPKLSLINKTP